MPFSYAGQEILTDDFSFLTAHIVVIGAQNKAFSFVTGQDTNGQPLYSCTGNVAQDNGLSRQLGKYRRDWAACDVSWGGHEVLTFNSGLVDGLAQ